MIVGAFALAETGVSMIDASTTRNLDTVCTRRRESTTSLVLLQAARHREVSPANGDGLRFPPRARDRYAP
jgi:hypothetical protein